MQEQFADVLDDVAADLKDVARQPTSGATEVYLCNTLARVFTLRAAMLRDDAAAAQLAQERRDAEASIRAAGDSAAAKLAGGADPSQFSSTIVEAYLASVGHVEAQRVLDAERAGLNRPGIVTHADAILAAAADRDAGDPAPSVAEQPGGPGSEAAGAPADAPVRGWDPADYTVPAVNRYLLHASPEERTRVLDLERADRPNIPDGKKQRSGILDPAF